MREPEVPTEAQWRHEQRRAVAERAHDAESEFSQHTNNATINNANIALRTLVLINGGAAVTILAFVGSLVPKLQEDVNAGITALTMPLIWFAWGVALASIGTMLAYLTNYCITTSTASKEHHYDHPYVRPTKASKRWWWAAIAFQLLAFGAAAASLTFFILGMYEVRASIFTVAL